MKASEEHFEEDKLRRYLNKGTLEPAPSDFTQNLMAKLDRKKYIPKVYLRPERKSLVPVISLIVAFALILAVFLLPEDKSNADSILHFRFLTDFTWITTIAQSLPPIRINFPDWSYYLIPGLLLLFILDRLLFRLFYRNANS